MLTRSKTRVNRLTAEINEKLNTLRTLNPNGRYGLNPCLTEREIATFERRWDITLPEEYRQFLLHVGNGGEALGVSELGKPEYFGSDPQESLESLVRRGRLNPLSQPFPFADTFEGDPALAEEYEELIENGDDEEELKACEQKMYQQFDISGAIPIIYCGCTIHLLLVITGKERGNIWRIEYNDVYGSVEPLNIQGKARMNFGEWCLDYLNPKVEYLQASISSQPEGRGFRR